MGDILVSWDSISAILFAGSFAMIAFTHTEMRAARVLLVVGVIIVMARWGIWSFTTDAEWIVRALVGASFGALLLGGAPALWRWSVERAAALSIERPIVPVGKTTAADSNSGAAFKRIYKNMKCFDYSTQNGVTQIINGSSTFNIRFSKSSDQDIFVLSSASNVSAVARVRHTPPKAATEFDKLDSSSREYTVRVGEQFIVKNNSGQFLQGKILAVKDDRSSPVDEVCFAYEFDQSGVEKFSAL